MNKIIKFNDMLLLESKSGYFSFTYKDEPYKFESKTKKGIFVDVVEWLYKNNYNFKAVKVFDSVPDGHRKDHYHNIGNSNNFIDINFIKQYQGLILMLSDFGVDKLSISFGEVDSDENSKENLLTKKYTFVEAAQLILKQNDNRPMTALEIWEEANTQNLVETLGKTPKATMNAQMIVYSDNTNAIGKKKNSIFKIIEDKPYKFILLNPNEEVQPIPDELDNSDILPPSKFIKFQEKPNVKNPFGCKDKDGEETSTLCIIGKSGSGKTTSTEIALESMGHEYLLYIPIEGEYTFSQYTGEEFEMSSLGEFMMMAQNDLGKCYTVIFDECHRPITISKLNTDLLQALSSRRNRGGERFVTMDRSTKRMYTSSTDEFPITLKAVSGKLLVPDNFGIVCLSSNPSVICRNDDFLNRVDLVVFHESDRNVKDLTELKKLEPSEKNIESIRGLLLSDGKQI
jgi:hypothetical protein